MAENKEVKNEEQEKKITISDLEYDKKGNLLFEEKILSNDELEKIFKFEGTELEESAVVSNSDAAATTITSTVVTSGSTTTSATPVVNTSEPGEVVGTYTIEVTEEKLPSTPENPDPTIEDPTEKTPENQDPTKEDPNDTTHKTYVKEREILSNDEIEINKKKYKTTLEKDGSLKSADGKSKLTQDELLKELGKDAYIALLLKTKKKVTVSNGHIEIEDPKEEVEMEIKPSKEEAEPAPKEKIKEEADKKEKTKKETKKETKKGTKSDINNNVTPTPVITPVPTINEKPSTGSDINEKTKPDQEYEEKEKDDKEKDRLGKGDKNEDPDEVQETKKPEFVRIDFDKLTEIASQLRTNYDLLVQLQQDYTMNVLNTSTVWTGSDGDYFRKQKGTYAKEFQTFNENYLEFIQFIEETIAAYQEAEKNSVLQSS